MKKYLVVLAAMVMVIAMVSGVYADPTGGSTTKSVAASATINRICVIGGSPAIAFNSLDATMTGPYPGSVTAPTLWCTNGVSVAVTDNGGMYGSMSGGTGATWNLKAATSAAKIPYTLTYTTPLTGGGTAVELGGTSGLNITASIADGALSASPADNYSDTIILTFTY